MSDFCLLVCSTKIDEISDISKCFEDFVSQALGVLTRIYAAELRYYINIKDISDDYFVLSGCLLEGDTVRTHKIILKPNKNYDIISITSSRIPPDTIHIYVDYKGRMIKRKSIKHV